jgi:FAD/FMN-containing dehydrogenase
MVNDAAYRAAQSRLGSAPIQKRRRRQGVMSWKDAELLSRIFAVTTSNPWINLEYAVPVGRADEAARGVVSILRGVRVATNFVMRPVGADSAGYLSPTRGRPTVFFDVGYHRELLHTGVYTEIERLLLACDGRCSWSRLFRASPQEVVKQYPLHSEFVRAKREMDPCNVFSSAFSDSILFPELAADV